MRILLFVLGILIGTATIGTRAEAQNYPWCAQYSGPGGMNCGFVSYAQCMLTLSGMGGFCLENSQYHPATAVAYPPRKPQRRYSRAHS